MSEIIPAVLPKTREELLDQATALPDEIKLFHLDVLEEDVWTPIERGFEAHLMVQEPDEIVERWIERGAKRLIVHKPIKRGEGAVEIGLGVEMHMPMEEVFALLPQFDFVHLMSIREIGAQGRPFVPEIFDRIRQVKERFPDKPVSVDGGINVSNFRELEQAGADRLVVGSAFQELWSRTKQS